MTTQSTKPRDLEAELIGLEEQVTELQRLVDALVARLPEYEKALILGKVPPT